MGCARALANQVPAMRADVGQAVDAILIIAREQKRIVDRAFKKRAGINVAWRLDDVGVGNELPGARERAALQQIKRRRIGTKRRGRRVRFADVGIDLETGHERMLNRTTIDSTTKAPTKIEAVSDQQSAISHANPWPTAES